MAAASPRLPKLHPSRSGYTLAGEFVEGFGHRPDLEERAQLRIARWARQLGDSVTGEQETLLAEQDQKPASDRQVAAREATELLRDPSIHMLWSGLTKPQQQSVLMPDRTPGLEGRTWPFSSRELALLVDREEHQIRRWADNRKLPHWRKGRNRLFPQAAAIVAFSLADSDQLDQSYASRVVQPDGVLHLRRAVGIASMERSFRVDRDDGELAEFAKELRDLADGIDRVRAAAAGSSGDAVG